MSVKSIVSNDCTRAQSAMQLRVEHGMSKVMLAAILLATFPGCIVLSRNPPYPSDWAPLSSERIEGCPSISGTFQNVGVMHIESGKSCDKHQETQSSSDGIAARP